MQQKGRASLFPRYPDWSVVSGQWSVVSSDRSSTSYSSSSSVRDMEVGSVIPNCYFPSTNSAVIVDMNDYVGLASLVA